MKKSILPILLALTMTFSCLATACTPDGGGANKPSESDVTYVRVLHYDAGYGRTHLEKTARAFEKAVADVSYEEGKKGVYIDIEHSQMNATGEYLLNSLNNSPYDMFFSTGITPAAMKANGYVMDVTNLMNATSENSTYRFAEEKSIYERMYPDMQEYYINEDNSLFGAPVFVISHHLFYDVELVQSRGLYIKKGSTDTALSYTKNVLEAQAGIDGTAGTTDDGLPETWAQFYIWLQEIYDKGITPMHYSGLYQQHMDYSLQQFWADFEGKENVKACWTFDGTEMTNLIDTIDENGNVTYLPATAITVDNGYMVQKQEGRYRVMQMAKKFADTMSTSEKWIHNYAFSGSETHTEAQGTYISSKYSKPIMLFAEGSYWEAEARDKFASYESRKGGRLDRKFAVLPIPKFSREDVGVDSRATVLAMDGMSVFVHKKAATASNKDAVADFFMYYNSSSNMDMQHIESSSIRPYSYVIDDTVKADMSYLQQDLYNYMNNDRTDVVFGCDNNDFYRANASQLNKEKWVFYSQFRKSGDEKSYISIKTFKDNNSHENLVTAEDYFNGFYKIYTYRAGNAKTLWETMLAKIGK